MHVTRISRSILDRISPEQRKIQLRLVLKDSSEGLILNLSKVFYLSNSLCNLLNLRLLNNNGMYQDKENKTFYKIYTRQILA